MIHDCYPTFNDAYRDLVTDCLHNGEPFTPRGLPCRELRPHAFSIARATEGLYTGHDRKLNYRFYAVEALSYIAGWGDRPTHADLLVASCPPIGQFRNEQTDLFDGAYGPRLALGMHDLVETLRYDPSSRQAVTSIWNPGTLAQLGRGCSRDLPCTLSLHCYQSQGALAMTASMRSNDLRLGTPYDVAAFCAIQVLVARLIGLPPGAYHHYTGSLHLYDGQVPDLDPNTEHMPYLWVPDPGHEAVGSQWMTWANAADCYLHELRNHLQAGDEWHDFISPLEQATRTTHDKNPLATWLSHWGLLLRFRWSDVEGDDE